MQLSQIAKTVQVLTWNWMIWFWFEAFWKRKIDLEVFGLSLFPSQKKLQVRHGDQPWYPHVLWPLRWTIAHSTWMVPLHLNKCNDGKSPQNKKKPIMTISAWVRSFTSFQMFHTHTQFVNRKMHTEWERYSIRLWEVTSPGADPLRPPQTNFFWSKK